MSGSAGSVKSLRSAADRDAEAFGGRVEPAHRRCLVLEDAREEIPRLAVLLDLVDHFADRSDRRFDVG